MSKKLLFVVVTVLATSCGSSKDAPDGGGLGVDSGDQPDAARPGHDAGPTCAPPCGTGEACLGTSCAKASFASLCSLGAATVLKDGASTDDGVDDALSATLTSTCGAAFKVTMASLADPLVFDPGLGGLNTAPGLVVTAGGPFFNKLVAALEDARQSPLYFSSDTTSEGFTASATGKQVAGAPPAAITDAHDFFVVELFSDGYGHLVLVQYGIGVPGTLAAQSQVQAMLASPAGFQDAWYVYEWTKGDAGAAAVRVSSGK